MKKPSKAKSERVGFREKAFMGLCLISIVFAAAMIFHGPVKKAEISPLNLEELSTTGFVEVEPDVQIIGNRAAVSLTGSCYRVVAGTEMDQAQSIRDGIDGLNYARPNAHALIRDSFDVLDVEMLMMKVMELKDRSFHGKLVVRQGQTIASLEAKPSDGIAVAVRTGAKIYFNETLMKENGQKIC